MLSAQPANADIVFSWNGGNAVGLPDGTATGVNPYIPAFIAGPAGTATITVVATLANCIDTEIFNVVVLDDATAFAGNDRTICSSEALQILGATASNHTSVNWSTNGTGSFDNPGKINPIYTPSAGDINSGQVVLSMSSSNSCSYASDFMVLTIWQASTAYAGADAVIGTGSEYQVLDAWATNFESLQWTLDGEGNLNFANTLSPKFFPVAGQTGVVTLTLTVTPEGSGACGTVSDVMTITIGEGPQISLEKRTVQIVLNDDGSALVTFEFNLENTGNVNLSSIGLVDDLAAAFPGTCSVTVQSLTSDGFNVNASFNGYSNNEILSSANTLDVGAKKAVLLTLLVADCHESQTYFENTATARGTSPGGYTVYDADEAEVNLVESPLVGLSKQLVSVTNNLNGTYTAQISFRVKNYGDVTLTEVALVDDLDLTFGTGNYNVSGLYSEEFAVNPAFNGGTVSNVLSAGNTLGVGQTGAVLLTVQILSPGVYTNTATVGANTPRGGYVFDMSHDGSDPAPGGGNNPNDFDDPTIIDATDCVTASSFAGPGAEICAGSSYQIIGAEASDYQSIKWSSNGDGSFNFDNILLPVYTPGTDDQADGSVILTFTAYSYEPCLPAVSSMTLTITTPPAVSAGIDASICNTQTSYLLSSASASNYESVKWSTSGTGTFDNTGIISATYTPSIGDVYGGQVVLTLTAYGNGSCANTSDYMVISIFPPATANAGPDATVCSGDQFAVSGASANHYLSLEWSHNGSGNLLNSNTLTPTYQPGTGESGEVILTLFATGYGTCPVASDAMKLIISPSPTANAGIDKDLCNQVMFILSGNKVPNATVQWSVEAGPNYPVILDANKPTAVVLGAVPGTYTFVYTVSAGSCSHSDKVVITNWEQLICCISAGQDIAACDVTSVTMNGSLPMVGEMFWSQISGPNQANIVEPSNRLTEINGLIPGTYTFRYTNFNGPACSILCDDVYVTISNSASADAGEDATICQYSTITLSEATAGNYSSLQWATSGTGLFSNKNTLNPVYTPSASDILNGFAVLTLTASSSSPCIPVSSSMMLTIQAPALLVAVDDYFGPLNGYDGTINIGVALSNDLMNGSVADPTLITATLITPAIPLQSGKPVPVFDPSTGIVSVSPQTPAGIYTITYEICENLCPDNCSQAEITIEVAPAVIVANDDDLTVNPINGYVGGIAGVILPNDQLNGASLILSQISRSITDDGGLTGVSVNVSNQVVVPAATPAGNYTVTYTLCEVLNPTNCDDAEIYILVVPPSIDAVDDDFTANVINGFTGGTAGDVSQNDKLNGSAVNAAEVSFTVVDDGGVTGVSFNINSQLIVPSGVSAGNYTITYQMCEIINPDNCDQAVALVEVAAPLIVANNNDYTTSNPVNGNNGGTVGSILDNDHLNGSAVTTANIHLTLKDNGGITGLSIDDFGIITIPSGTEAGVYTVTYEICELINPTNCDDADVTIKVYTPDIKVTKVATPLTYTIEGDVIFYTITVENTGDVAITNLVADDPLATTGPAYVSGDAGTTGDLDVGEIWTYSATYTITQSDLDNGTFTNTVTVDGKDPYDDPVEGEASATVTALINPGISLLKSSLTTPNSYSLPGDELTYLITLENIGNLTLSNIQVVDPLTGMDETIATLSPGSLVTLTATYVITQTDIDLGKVINTATATGTYTVGSSAPQEISGMDDETIFAIQSPAIEVTKTSTKNPNYYSNIGDILTYSVKVENTGNVTLNNIIITDPLTGMNQNVPILLPGAFVSFNTSYVVDLDDLNFGRVDNTASATGYYTDVNNVSKSVTDSDTETIYSLQTPKLGLVKLSSYNSLTGLITYTYVVTNTGNVTAYDIVINETSFTGTGTIPNPVYFTGGSHIGGNTSLRDIIPGQRIIFTATYATTLADRNIGYVINQAKAIGIAPGGTLMSDFSDHTNNSNDRPTVTTLNANPSLTVEKTSSSTSYGAIGEEIQYSIIVTNTGDVTIVDISVEDPLTQLSTTIASLVPYEQQVFDVSYIITENDLNHGSVVNVAAAEGEDPNGNLIYAEDSVELGVVFHELKAIDDDYGKVDPFNSKVSVGNVLVNDILNGTQATISSVVITVLQPASNPGVQLNANTGEVNVSSSTPNGVYTMVYSICQKMNMMNCSEALVIIEVEKSCIDIEASVLLEGASIVPDGSSSYSLPMRSSLNNLRILPGQTFSDFFIGTHYTPAGQPYNAAPWFYNGTEGDEFDSQGDPAQGDAGYPSTVVDWVLVTLRSNPEGTGGPVCQAAALLHQDGSIEFIGDKPPCCDLDGGINYYIVVEHRNHLIVMSDVPLPISDGKVTYDFTLQQSYVNDPFGFGIYSGQKEILTGKFAMFGGNGEQAINAQSDTDINLDDRIFWENENGVFARYRSEDYNLNGDINQNDRMIWQFNTSRFSSVPRD